MQAQIAALQRSQRRKEDVMAESRGLMKSLPLLRNIILFICPIAVMTLFGSVVVGTYEKWNVVDSIYWCVMTGTSVGCKFLITLSFVDVFGVVVFVM